ncbi:hypothetical protein [Oleiagrimonas sp. C23AA]|uniref:hypothetical protein n=1 Tax=Oleiagrimonas sp. C23AA TaxID=2719047 RepID=UPI00141F8858|nr:hypothetical protein [Oleiagrimonas sp. C23AA]NII11877.1 hypothetical protein [Oleiagrimonas sp. C23AA]
MKTLTISVACVAFLGVIPGARAADSVLGQQWASAADSLLSGVTSSTGTTTLSGNGTDNSSVSSGAMLGSSRSDSLSDRPVSTSSNSGTDSSEASATSNDRSSVPDNSNNHGGGGHSSSSRLGWQSFLPGSIQ